MRECASVINPILSVVKKAPLAPPPVGSAWGAPSQFFLTFLGDGFLTLLKGKQHGV
jgi:hypothetical protein